MRSLRLLLPAILITLVGAAPAAAKVSAQQARAFKYANSLAPGAKRLHFQYGPIKITPGQNFINTEVGIPKPKVNGYITRFNPNLHYAIKGSRKLGAVPRVDVIHLHHGVWLAFGPGKHDATAPGLPERFAAAGEEKTRLRFPNGYGYPFSTKDTWVLNYMIHNLTPHSTKVWITYDADFVPASSPVAKTMKAVKPIWMDVENGKIYPVFDALRGTGKNGAYTYPSQDPQAYARQRQRAQRRGRTFQAPNRWTVPYDGDLVATAGHLHPGGLHTDLYDSRNGKRVHLFRSQAHYFEPAGAVSWDVSMSATRKNWRVHVKKGDVLSTTATYDTSHASWYEVMGIMVVFLADGQQGLEPFQSGQTAKLHAVGGKNPFAEKIQASGFLTHGHLAENRHHGGAFGYLPNPLKMAKGRSVSDKTIDIKDYLYGSSNLATQSKIPTVRAGHSITFKNLDDKGVGDRSAAWHTVTACKSPCNKTTGIAYPIANGSAKYQFDSGELGDSRWGPPVSGGYSWKTPSTLPIGTYSYFCRIHPFMRGSFRVVH